jgi:D-alanyl-D-alanine carboxypeptidase/D-alanyl-D-alanine-endopeptidase (penicillin-binding protein 4)
VPLRGRLPRGRRGALAVIAALLVVALAGTLTGLAATDRLPGQQHASATPTPTPGAPRRSTAGPVLAAPSPAPTSSTPATAGLRTARLTALLADPALGGDPSAVVLDAGTGATLLDRDATVAHTPASVAKLATTTAALVAIGPQTRFATRTVVGARPDQVVLVGGGDPTLALRRDRGAAYPRRATLTALADATAAALRRRTPVAPVVVRVDDSRYAGPAVSPAWPAGYVPAGVVSPVSALSVDQGRVQAGSDAREPDPALAAGRDLARLLRARGVAVRGAVTRTTAPAAATTLAAVRSPTVAEIVETDLQTSDNDLAEGLLRQVAIARHQPATFDGGTSAVVAVLDELGIPTDGVVLRDGSGLSRQSEVPAQTFARILTTAAADRAHPALRTVVTSLPVAGFSGTLAFRYGTGATRRAAGLVRAKTGTLTGVSSLAGLTGDGSRSLVFVVMSDGVPAGGTVGARTVLDRFAATVAAGADGGG